MVFPGWFRAVAAVSAGAALLGVPTTALAAGNGPASGHGRTAQTAAAVASPSPTPATGSWALAIPSLSSVTATPAPTPAPTPRPAPSASTGMPAVAAAPAPAAAVVAPQPRRAPTAAPVTVAAAVEPWPRGARVSPALEGFPEVVLPPGAEGTRLAVALLAFPLLVAIWLWALGRGVTAAWHSRGARTRALLAQQLGVTPGELAGLGEAGLLRLRDQVAFDDLTGVARRAAGLAALDREASRARRDGLALSVAFVDVDGLKLANDTHGHEAGDALLRGVAALLTGRLRGHDVVFRFGGDEFVAVLPATTVRIATGILDEVRERGLRSGLSFSYGVAQLREGEATEQLLARADALQYEDKRARRVARIERAGVPAAGG